MASLMASSGNAVVRSSNNANRIATNSISSLRVKPFTKLVKNSSVASKQQQQQPLFRLRAAEPEVEAEIEAAAPAEDNDFEFSLSDAKKNNDYAASDVEAALRFYFEGGASPACNDDFVSNNMGEEDASFFDDIDNNEAYDAEEFLIAGIPEAAPKKRRVRRNADGEEEEVDEDDQISKGKQLDKIKALEDRMVMEAALEEEYGSEYDRAEEDVQVVATQGVWDWLTDADANAEGAEEFSSSKLSSVRRSKAVLPSDYEVLSGFSTLKVDELDEQTRDMLELIIGDEVSEEELRTVDAAVDAEVPESEVFTQEEIASLDALASEPVEALEIEDVSSPIMMSAAEENELSKDALDSYMGSLAAAAAANSDVTADEVKALFAADGEAVEVDDEAEPDDAEVEAILGAAEPAIPTDDILDLAELDSLLISGEEEADYEIKDIKQEIRSLAQMEDFNENDMPDEQQLDILEQYISSSEQYLDAEEERRNAAQKLVIDGELSADVFAEDLEELPDMERDFAEDFGEDLANQEDDDNLAAYEDDEDDGEQWLERIIELNRVTKVVKGGKIMGFRCTAIVGNQNGLVGVGCMAGREVAVAAKRALVDAKKNVIRVPLVGKGTIPHKMEAKYHAARIVLVPASDGTGVIAGSSIKSVLELAGVQNVLAKRIGCRSPLNNARATIKALTQLKSLNEVARARGVPMDRLLLPRE